VPNERGEPVYGLAPGSVHWRMVDGEVLGLDIEREEYFATNRAGNLLWSALADGATRDGLVERLTSSEGVDTDRARTDVDAFLAQLRERGLLAER
jgi:hypothetical protein